MIQGIRMQPNTKNTIRNQKNKHSKTQPISNVVITYGGLRLSPRLLQLFQCTSNPSLYIPSGEPKLHFGEFCDSKSTPFVSVFETQFSFSIYGGSSTKWRPISISFFLLLLLFSPKSPFYPFYLLISNCDANNILLTFC